MLVGSRRDWYAILYEWYDLPSMHRHGLLTHYDKTLTRLWRQALEYGVKEKSFSNSVPNVGLSIYSEESYHKVPGHGIHDMKKTLE